MRHSRETEVPLHCRGNCLLDSMSNGFDISLSINCKPWKTQRKHRTFNYLEDFSFLFFLFTCVKVMCSPWWMHSSHKRHHWSVSVCRMLPVQPRHLIWTSVTERTKTDHQIFTFCTFQKEVDRKKYTHLFYKILSKVRN